MEPLDMRINAPAAYTYSWLRMNQTDLPGIAMEGGCTLTAEVPREVEESALALPAGILTGAGGDMDRLVAQAGVQARIYTAKQGRTGGGALRLHFTYGDAGMEYDPRKKSDTKITGKLDALGLVLEAGSELTVVMDYASPAEASGLAGIQVKAEVGENALLRLVQIQRLGKGFTLLHDTGVRCADGGRVELVRLILGGKNTYDGCKVALEGDVSCLDAAIGYLVSGDGHLDMNYEAVHTGKKTRCEITASGVLRDRAFKLLRGTIDLKNGCSGAVGNEVEDVLLMDDTVHNQTIPVILCAEEDVVGNHGATIGRLDEGLIYYLQSRGMEREAIYEMMAKAKIDSVIKKIPDRTTLRNFFPALAPKEDEA